MTLVVVVVGVLIARAVARPIQRAADTMNAISRLDLTTPLPDRPSALAEIQTLNTAVTMMHTALSGFTRYVPGDLVRNLLDLRQPLELGGMRREITVLFTDIEGFTQLTETEQHEQMVDGLADYSTSSRRRSPSMAARWTNSSATRSWLSGAHRAMILNIPTMLATRCSTSSVAWTRSTGNAFL